MSVSLYKISVIESHTFYRKWKKKLWCWISGDGSWLQVWASEVHTKGGGNSHTFDLLGLSLESCEVFKAHTRTKDSISLTYNVDGQCSQLFLQGVRIDGAKHCPLVCILWSELLPSPALSLLGSEACWSNDIRHSPGYQVCFNFVSFSQKQCMHPGLCQKLI